jgi:hypothetical protein
VKYHNAFIACMLGNAELNPLVRKPPPPPPLALEPTPESPKAKRGKVDRSQEKVEKEKEVTPVAPYVSVLGFF